MYLKFHIHLAPCPSYVAIYMIFHIQQARLFLADGMIAEHRGWIDMITLWHQIRGNCPQPIPLQYVHP